MTYDPKICNIYGFIDANKKGNGNTTMYDISELLNVSTTTHADAPRISMQSVQQKHIISIKDPDPLLIGSGIEKVVPYLVSDEFAFKAKEDGIVESIDYKNKLMILRYKSGKKDFVDLGVNEIYNSNGGFYISQRFKALVGSKDKFKKSDILALNEGYFNKNNKNEVSYTMGKLAKVAITSGDFTLEDSSLITESLSEAMATKITMKKTLLLDKNATLSFVAKENSIINTNDPLAIYENSFNDDSISDVLNKIGSEFANNIAELSKNTLKSKYTGKVAKVNMYYTLDIEEYSPSIQKILKEYIANGKARKKVMEEIKGNGFDTINAPVIDKQVDKKIRGEEIGDGLLIEFFIEYDDKLSIGDKIIFGTALKTIVSTELEKGEEPYSDFRPEENIDAILSPLSINSRMTLDIFIDGGVNKCLVELKRKCKEIFES